MNFPAVAAHIVSQSPSPVTVFSILVTIESTVKKKEKLNYIVT